MEAHEQERMPSPPSRSVTGHMSPPRSRTSSKPKRPPPVTPKRFNKFFTPRSSSSFTRRAASSRSARQLRDITKAAINKTSIHRHGRKVVSFEGIENAQPEPLTPATNGTPRKRKHVAVISSSPVTHSSPCKRLRVPIPASADIHSSPPSLPVVYEDDDDAAVETAPEVLPESAFCQPLRRIRRSNTAMRVLERSFGVLSTADAVTRTGWNDPRYKTSDFYSFKRDQCAFPRANLPFSTAACQTNSLVAAGTEDGSVWLLDTSSDAEFRKPVLLISPHSNAVMDLQFSHDDMLLASCGGDQTARLTDMRTQQVSAVFQLHSASIKQVRFQPGDNNILASCSRDGTVALWDVRCSGMDRPVQTVVTDPSNGNGNIRSHSARHYSDALHIIHKAHPNAPAPIVTSNAKARDMDRREAVGASVTSLSFLSASRSHLLVTASELTTSLKLWDLRCRYSRHSNAPSLPVSSTAVPRSHLRTRHYGVTSMSMDSTASTIYALSRDSTLYAYSTNHLVLGSAPEMLPTKSQKSRFRNDERAGLGPLCGFRNPRLRVTSYFVKCAVRPATADKPELVATGSSDAVSILFSTDARDRPHTTATPAATFPTTAPDECPIYDTGTALASGHRSEVSTLCWTSAGRLVTGSDDFSVRCWREDRDEALRLRGLAREPGWRMETEDCGWADVDAEFDDWDE